MQLIVIPQTNIIVGDPSNRISFTATIGFTGIAPTIAPLVQAAVVSNDLSLMIINPVSVALSSFLVVNNVATISGNIAFSATDTCNFLTVPSNLASPLIKSVTRIGEISTATLEIQIGSPFYETWQAIISVGKGLIP